MGITLGELPSTLRTGCDVLLHPVGPICLPLTRDGRPVNRSRPNVPGVIVTNAPDQTARRPATTGPAPEVAVRAHLDRDDGRRWDDLVRATPGADVTQLTAWARVRRGAGFSALYVLARRDGELVGGAQVLVRRLPLLGRVGYVPYGPLVATGARRAEVVTALADALTSLARHDLRALFVQPLDGEDLGAALRARGFRPSDAGVAPAHTVRIDLTPPVTELRAGLSKRVRRWTGKWEARGVRVRHGGEADLGVLLGLLERSSAHQGYTGLSHDYLRTLYRELDASDQVALLIGEVHGEPVAAELFTACGGVLRARLTGMDRESPAAKLSVTSAIDWHAMLWARERGLREFDMGGMGAEAVAAVRRDGPGAPALTGPDRFKLGFGGRVHSYPGAVELIPSPVLRAGYERLSGGGGDGLRRLRRWMRGGRA
jgi:lipid II:glycine glycyltransferase (peptidoglycan interpeptide bridge formation enzyme)